MMDELAVRIGERIRATRKTLGMTQAVLAEHAGMSTQFVAELEAGKKNMSVLTLARICEALNVSPDFMMGMEHEPPTEMDIIIDYLRNLPKEHIPDVVGILRAYQSIVCRYEKKSQD